MLGGHAVAVRRRSDEPVDDSVVLSDAPHTSARLPILPDMAHLMGFYYVHKPVKGTGDEKDLETRLLVCDVCGGYVSDDQLHHMWHDALKQGTA